MSRKMKGGRKVQVDSAGAKMFKRGDLTQTPITKRSNPLTKAEKVKLNLTGVL